MQDGKIANRTNQDDEIICSCVNLTLGELRALSTGKNGASGFDDMLERTGAGADCTACLLDLEYFYSEPAQRSAARANATSRRAPGRRTGLARPGLKQRLYRLVDRFSPMVPVHLVNPVPVLAWPGLEQSVCVANDTLLYDGERGAPPMIVGLKVRDRDGHMLYSGDHRVDSDSALNFNVSRFLEPPAANSALPSIGTVEVSRRAERPGVRGTTRPQIVIEAAAGACAVHSQAASDNRKLRWFNCVFRPAEERILLTVMNGGKTTVRGEFVYPHDAGGVDPVAHAIEVPPFGIRIHEVSLPEAEAARIDGEPLTLSYRFEGKHKVHVLCATPSLDRLSIDHL